jgi:hypothetical protein
VGPLTRDPSPSLRPPGSAADPREIIDEVTGEVLDVVQDNDPDLPPGPDSQEPNRSLDPSPRAPLACPYLTDRLAFGRGADHEVSGAR